MNKEKKKVFFSVSIVDYKTFEKYLESMALKGWLIEKYNTFTIEFRKVKPAKYKFNVSLFYNPPFEYSNEEKFKNYQERYEELGWTFVKNKKLFQICYALEEDNPILINTDPIEEYKMRKSIFYKTELISLISIMFLSFIVLSNLTRFDYTFLYRNMTLWRMITPIFMLLMTLPYIYDLFFLMKVKRAVKEGKKFPITSYRTAKFKSNSILLIQLIYAVFTIGMMGKSILDRGSYTYLIALLPAVSGILFALWYKKFVKKKKRSKKKNIVIFIVLAVITIVVSTSLTFGIIVKSIIGDTDKEVEKVDLKGYKVLTLSDFGIEADKIKNNLWKESSIFVPMYYDYYEIANKKSIDTEYIKARNERICNYIYGEILKEKSSKSYYHITKGNPKKWEADEVHYLSDDHNFVMIKKDHVIVILEGDFDFSDTKVIEKCKKLLKE